MAKYVTPEMEKINSRKAKKKETEYNYWKDAWKRLRRNKVSMIGLAIIVLLLLIAIFANQLIPYSYAAIDPLNAYQSPSAEHLFGTDNLGRDIFSRCIYATRISLPMAFVCAAISVIVGGLLGLISAYFMGITDQVVMRVMDVLQAIPGTLMAICVVACIGTGIPQLILAIAISSVPMLAKTVRSAALTVRDSEFVEASRAVGAGNLSLMFSHIIPNCVGHVILFIVSSVSAGIMLISGMSYIGLGIQPPTPEWGSLLSEGKTYIQSYPYMVIFPGIMILITVFAFNVLGDGVRDALDPKLK